MNCTFSETPGTWATASAGPGELTELVRGQERRLLEKMMPLVRSQSVTLDLSPVERIDAAGIAALISLYCGARETGHIFTVCNASPRVAEILALVGLDRILLSQYAVQIPHSGPCRELTAA